MPERYHCAIGMANHCREPKRPSGGAHLKGVKQLMDLNWIQTIDLVSEARIWTRGNMRKSWLRLRGLCGAFGRRSRLAGDASAFEEAQHPCLLDFQILQVFP